MKRKVDEMSSSNVVAARAASFDPSRAVASMFDSEKYSDLIIICQDKSFHVHRVIVCSQSKPLAACVDGEFKEAATGVIHLPDDDPETVECMLRFLYSSDYSYDVSNELLTHTKVYILAEKYDIPALKFLATLNYEDVLPQDLDDSLTVLSFFESLKLMYLETVENDRLLKDIAVKFAHGKAKELTKMDDFVKLFKLLGNFAFDMYNAALQPVKAIPTKATRGARKAKAAPIQPEFCKVCGDFQNNCDCSD